MSERAASKTAKAERDEMVETQLAARGIVDPRVLRALRAVPRELFVPEQLSQAAYEDRPLPIGENQTISQPYIVGLMLAALELTGTERVLEVGTGSGYSAALLSCLAAEVYSIERLLPLAMDARQRLRRLGYPVRVKHGDGTLGWREQGPFDAITVAAGGPHVPHALIEQLAPGGRLVMPVMHDGGEVLVKLTNVPGQGIRVKPLEPVRFVPLIGVQGHPEPASN